MLNMKTYDLEEEISSGILSDELAKRLLLKCDSFVLVECYNSFEDETYVEYYISPEDSEKILKKGYATLMESSKIMWNRVYCEERGEFSTFEDFIVHVEEERKAIVDACENSDDPARYFMCDKSHGESKSSGLWNICSDQDIYIDWELNFKSMQKSTKQRDIISSLKEPGNEQLLNNYIGSELSFYWHLTMTNHLYIIHRFKLNNETMEWLKGMQNMFTHHHGFEDPAFFKGEEYIL